MHNNTDIGILKTIQKSVYSPSFYGEPSRLSPGPAWVYFFKFALIVALCQAVIFCIFVGPPLVGALSKESLRSIAAQYPADLTLTIQAGKASTNVKEPYYVLMPASIPNQSSGSAHKNLVVIDTVGSSSLDTFKTYDTAFLVTKDYIISEKGGGQINVAKVDALPDMTLNQASIQGFVERTAPYLRLVLPILFVFLIIGFFLGITVGNIIFLLLAVLIVWAVSRAFKSGLSYAHCYALGLYALTGPILLDILLKIFNVRAPWYVGTVLFFILYFINTKKHYVVVKSS